MVKSVEHLSWDCLRIVSRKVQPEQIDCILDRFRVILEVTFEPGEKVTGSI